MNNLFPMLPAQENQPSAGVDKPGIAEKWRGWLSKPENAAMLMQTGIALLQPPTAGPIGSVGLALGSGMQAKDRNIQAQRDEEQRLADNAHKTQADALALQDNTRSNLNSESDRLYKKRLGLSALMGGHGRTAAPRDQNKEYQDFVLKVRGDALEPFGPPDAPDWEAKVQAAWIAAQNRPGGNASAPTAVGAVPVPDASFTPSVQGKAIPPGAVDKVKAALAKNIPPEKIAAALRADGYDPAAFGL